MSSRTRSTIDRIPEHLSSLVTATAENRRRFLVARQAAGFAMAVCPITAETITTNTSGLDAGEMKVPAATPILPVA